MCVKLPTAAKYFPFEIGSYKVAAGLKPLRHDFGNGRQDGIVFQLDVEFPVFRDNMNRIRTDALGRYWDEAICAAPVMKAVLEWMVHRLVFEHPERFRLKREKRDQVR